MERGREKYPKLALDDLMDIGRSVLVEPDITIIAVSFLYKENKNRTRIEETDLPKTMTATSTEQSTPSSYAFLNKPLLR
jgi:hypothetical protein